MAVDVVCVMLLVQLLVGDASDPATFFKFIYLILSLGS